MSDLTRDEKGALNAYRSTRDGAVAHGFDPRNFYVFVFPHPIKGVSKKMHRKALEAGHVAIRNVLFPPSAVETAVVPTDDTDD